MCSLMQCFYAVSYTGQSSTASGMSGLMFGDEDEMNHKRKKLDAENAGPKFTCPFGGQEGQTMGDDEKEEMPESSGLDTEANKDEKAMVEAEKDGNTDDEEGQENEYEMTDDESQHILLSEDLDAYTSLTPVKGGSLGDCVGYTDDGEYSEEEWLKLSLVESPVDKGEKVDSLEVHAEVVTGFEDAVDQRVKAGACYKKIDSKEENDQRQPLTNNMEDECEISAGGAKRDGGASAVIQNPRKESEVKEIAALQSSGDTTRSLSLSDVRERRRSVGAAYSSLEIVAVIEPSCSKASFVRASMSRQQKQAKNKISGESVNPFTGKDEEETEKCKAPSVRSRLGCGSINKSEQNSKDLNEDSHEDIVCLDDEEEHVHIDRSTHTDSPGGQVVFSQSLLRHGGVAFDNGGSFPFQRNLNLLRAQSRLSLATSSAVTQLNSGSANIQHTQDGLSHGSSSRSASGLPATALLVRVAAALL